MLGGNDITSETSLSDLAQAIEALALQVEELTGGAVIILTVENRLQARNLSVERYKAIKNSTNRWLRKVLPNTKARCHPCGVMDGHLGPDGVHLNEAGNAALLETIIKLAEGWNNSQ